MFVSIPCKLVFHDTQHERAFGADELPLWRLLLSGVIFYPKVADLTSRDNDFIPRELTF